MQKEPRTSGHVLNASSNLLGICFVVITSIHLFSFSDKTIIDELTIIATILFMSACIFSFLAIRSGRSKLEVIADYIFLMGLILLFLTAALFSLNLIR